MRSTCPLAASRFASAAASPGHNGLKSLKQGLGSADFRRVRVGVGRPDTTDPEIVSAHVLGRFSEPEDEVRELVERAADELDALVGNLSEWPRGAPGGRCACSDRC